MQEKLIRLHCRGDLYKLDNDVRPRPVADDLIYNSGNTYAIPLLLYKTDLGPSIHQDHVEVFHKQLSGTSLTSGHNQAQMNINELMDFNPYLGRVSDPSQGQSEQQG